MTPPLIDHHLDKVLRASGSGLRYYTMQSTLTAMRKAMAEAMGAGGWQPIETCPKDQRVLLFRAGHIVCGRWDDDRFAAKPRPYWTHDQERLWGRADARKRPPTHWMPLPPPPEEGKPPARIDQAGGGHHG